MFLSEWREFPSAPCLAEKKKLDNGLRLDVVEMARNMYRREKIKKINTLRSVCT